MDPTLAALLRYGQFMSGTNAQQQPSSIGSSGVMYGSAAQQGAGELPGGDPSLPPVAPQGKRPRYDWGGVDAQGRVHGL